MNANEFQGRLETYLMVRSALGYKDSALKLLLRDFVKYVIALHDDGPIRAQVAVNWARTASASCGAAGQACRLSAARGFLAHLRASIPETEVPAKGLVASARRRLPYIFSQEQIVKLLYFASTIGPRGSLRPHTYETIIGLMASTGLRIGEAIRLKITDVELNVAPPRLQIWETKFRKSRTVPLHSTTAQQLDRYAKLRTEMGYAGLSDAFFISEQGKHLDHSSLWSWFRRATQHLNIFPADQRRRPTLHCLRHSFAVQRLTEWCQQEASVQDLTPNLAVYLGHVRPQDSYWYLTATPALLLTAAESFQRYVKNPGGNQ